MPLTVVLAVGLDSSLLAHRSSDWKSGGYIVTYTGSIREAIGYIRDGDFDLVLLGHAIPTDSRERLTFLIRASGSRTPVVCVADSPTECDSFADATIRNEPVSLLQGIGEVMAKRAKSTAPSYAGHCNERLRHSGFEPAGRFEIIGAAETTDGIKLTGWREIDASLAADPSPGQK